METEEIARGQSLLGPHRDDLIFYENGIDLRTYGSQGQQRTAILSMKMAAIDAYEQHLGTKPLLLLDDVMSELDFDRQRAVMEIVIKKQIQTFYHRHGIGFYLQKFRLRSCLPRPGRRHRRTEMTSQRTLAGFFVAVKGAARKNPAEWVWIGVDRASSSCYYHR